MSIRLNGNVANYLSRSSDLLDYNSAYTLMAWIRPETATGAQNIFVLAHLTSTAYDSLSMSGGVLSIAAANGSFPSGTGGSTLSAGTYRHVALVRVASNDLRLYLDGVLDATHTTSITARTALNRMLLGIWQSGGFGASDPYNGRYAAIKAWSAALTADEIQQELRTTLPRRLSGLYAFWPARPGSGERVKDYSGSARAWTENGTISDEDSPPLSWGARSNTRARSLTPRTGDAALTQAADALSSAGAVAIAGAASLTQSADTLAAAGAADSIGGAAAITQGADTVAAAGTVAISADAAISQAADTVSAAGTLPIAGDASISQAADTLSAAGSVAIVGAAAITQGADTLAAAGGAPALLGDAALTQAADTVSAAGTVATNGAAAITQAANTSTAAGAVATQGAASISQAADTVSAAGALGLLFRPWTRNRLTVPAEDYTAITQLSTRLTVPAESLASEA